MSSLPLEGIQVIECTHAVMGPSAGVVLADMGAEVIRIEPPSGDPTRRLKGFGSGYYSFYNRNKKTIPLDLKSDIGRKVFRRLIGDSHVLIENFGPGTMDRLGFGFEALSEVNAKLIYCSLKGFLNGPYEKRHAMDEVVQMMGGLAYMTGPSGKPLRAGASVVDVMGGMFGVIGILGALWKQKQNPTDNSGRFVTAALFETTAFLMGQHMAYAAQVDHPIPPMPERQSAWAVYRVFQCKAEPLFIGIISDKHWVRFCEAFGRLEWLQDERLASNELRIDASGWLLPQIEKIMASLDRQVVMQKCEEANIPFAPIARPEDLFTDPHLNAGNGLVEVELKDGSKAPLPVLPIAIDGQRTGLRYQPPKRTDIATDVLEKIGLSKEEIELNWPM